MDVELTMEYTADVTVTGENVINSFTFAPFTVSDPEDGDIVYPDTAPMEYEYVPLGSENEIVFVVDDSVFPFNVTDQDVPDGRPVSVNVTEYLTWVKVIATFTFAPLTVTELEYGDAEYP